MKHGETGQNGPVEPANDAEAPSGGTPGEETGAEAIAGPYARLAEDMADIPYRQDPGVQEWRQRHGLAEKKDRGGV